MFFTSGLISGWTDVTPYVDTAGGGQIVITRRASRVEPPVIGYEAGTCSMPPLNTDRRFDPTNSAGAYVQGGFRGVKPAAPVRVSATYSSVTYRLFNGTADAWTLSYAQPSDADAGLDCSDGFRVLAVQARTARTPHVGGREDSRPRVRRVLHDRRW